MLIPRLWSLAWSKVERIILGSPLGGLPPLDASSSADSLQSTSKSVPMMTQRQSFSFKTLEDVPAKILGLPYRSHDLSMFVLLPNDIDGLEKVKPYLFLVLPSSPEALCPRACFWVSLELGL